MVLQSEQVTEALSYLKAQLSTTYSQAPFTDILYCCSATCHALVIRFLAELNGSRVTSLNLARVLSMLTPDMSRYFSKAISVLEPLVDFWSAATYQVFHRVGQNAVH